MHGGRPFSRRHRRSSKSVESLFSLNSGQSSSSGVTSESDCSSNRNSLRLEVDLLSTKHFCGRARVHTEYVPSPYDTESLTLKVGNIIDIIAKPPMGIWKGVLHGRIGSFKFIYVDLLPEENLGTPLLEVRQKSTVQEVLKRLSLEEYSSSLQLNGYQTVDDLMRLREHHLLKLKVTHPEHRQRLLAAVYSLQQLREKRESTKENTNNCPRDSGCHMSSESTDMFPEDGEPHFTSSDHPLSAVLKALQQ
uniref:SAM domain-containing protein SAMSN-1-like n=1 Tax=Gouania willdenowi TaxID=441366 RepID=A0A8C5EDU9_GOUWI